MHTQVSGVCTGSYLSIMFFLLSIMACVQSITESY